MIISFFLYFNCLFLKFSCFLKLLCYNVIAAIMAVRHITPLATWDYLAMSFVNRRKDNYGKCKGSSINQ